MSFYTELRDKGFVFMQRPDLLQIFNVDQVEFDTCDDPDNFQVDNVPTSHFEELNTFLYLVHHDIAQTVLDGNCKSYSIPENGRSIWEGVNTPEKYKDKRILPDAWHSDSLETHNLFFLLYFNSMDDSAGTHEGGALWTRNGDGDVRHLIHPGLLVAINNSPNTGFLHRAEKSSSRRVLAQFKFNVVW